MTETLPALRKDLKILLHQSKEGQTKYFLSDEPAGRVFELGEQGQFLCRQLDGATTPDEALSLYQERFGKPLPRADLDAFVRQIEAEGFLQGRPARPLTFPEIFNPDSFLPTGRVRLFRGEKTVAFLARHFGFLFGRTTLFLGFAAMFVGFGILISRIVDIYDQLCILWGPLFLVAVLVLSILLVHTPRALLQGMYCKRHGGFVAEIGLVFIYYVVPEPYVKYSDLGWLEDRRRILRTLFVGIYYQFLICAVGIIGWYVTVPGWLPNALWLSLATGAGLGLVLVVGNPLVNVDGYRMLVTWMEIPSLRERALAAFGSWMGRRPLPEPLTAREKRGFLVFGTLVFVYAVLHLAVLSALAFMSLTASYQGAGFVATVGLAVYMVQRPLGRWLLDLPPVRWTLERCRRWGWRLGIGLAIVIVLLLPYPYETGGPFTVYPAVHSEVHCEIEGGRIEKVLVREGDLVAEGQPLAQIDKREYEKNLEVTRASLEESQAKLQYLRKQLALLDNPPNIETIDEMEAAVHRLEALQADYAHDLTATTLRAPIAGRVITAQIEQMAGKYLNRGDLFATLEQSETVQVEIMVPEEDAPKVKLGARVKVVAWAFPGTTFYGTVKSIAPIASTPVYPQAVPKINAVRVVADLPNADLRFKSQITGFAKIKTQMYPVWWVFTHLLIRWFQVQFWYWIP